MFNYDVRCRTVRRPVWYYPRSQCDCWRWSPVSQHECEIIVDEEIISSEKEEPLVRRLSLFDNISSSNSEKSFTQNEKTEPVISEDSVEIENSENLETSELTENKPEFNASSDELDEEFNQETEEELLDIPTFLRRQAN